MEWDSSNGEHVIRQPWHPCVICGCPTNLSAVCNDIICEIAWTKESK